MISRPNPHFPATRRACRTALLLSAVAGAALLISTPASADEISDLQAENAKLRDQVEALARDLQQLRDAVHQNSQAVAAAQESAASAGPVVTSDKDNTKLSISGQVNRMVMYADDGNEARWFHADNDESSTRLRFIGASKLDEEWSAGTNIEVQFESNPSNTVTINQNTAGGTNSFTERKLEIYFASTRLGKLSLGQGESASDGATETDLSKTGVIASSSSSAIGGGLQFHRSGTRGTGSGTTVGQVFNGLSGLGKDDRIRYDSPSFAGAKLSTSWVDGDEYDVALRYGREFDDTEVALSLAYWDASPTSQKDGFGGSLSFKLPSGTSLTGAYGEEDLEAVGRKDQNFWYAKLGQDFALTPLGATAVSLDYMASDDQNANGNEASGYGLAAVQFIDKIGTEIYGTVRWFDVDLPAIATDGITVGGIGARVKF
jgi:outer membrane murein-binding lipoprotein Lpp